MKKGGTAVWKSQVWFMLFMIVFLLSFLGVNEIVNIIKYKHGNYQDLWKWKGEVEQRLERLER